MALFAEDISMKMKLIVSNVRNITNSQKTKAVKSSNDGAKYCTMLKGGRTHLNNCVSQMVLRYSNVGGVYHW